MSDYEKYLLQQQAERGCVYNDMTLDERLTEFIEYWHSSTERYLAIDAHLEIIKLRAKNDRLKQQLQAESTAYYLLRDERDSLTAELAAAWGEHVWSKMGELGLTTMCLDWEIGRVFAFDTDGIMVADKETIQEVFDSLS